MPSGAPGLPGVSNGIFVLRIHVEKRRGARERERERVLSRHRSMCERTREILDRY